MIILTREQRITLHRKWCESNQGKTYRELRRSVMPLLGGNGCVMVPWCNMWLGIELNGEAHS